MNKATVLLTGLMMAASGIAQNQVLNMNFEEWSVMANGKDSAHHWSSSNNVVIGTTVSLLKETPGHSGTAAAHVVTSPFGFVQYSTLGILVNGDATFSYGGGGGGANVAYESGGGSPLSFKPTALKGFYKYETLTTSDQGMAVVLLTRYNTTLNKRDTVSLATHSFPVMGAYIPFEISLPDQMPGVMPDTITTIFYSSNPATLEPYSAWSDLFLDDLSLAGAPPVADFMADITNGTTNSVISFTDLSENTPTAWQWTVSPSAPAVYQNGTTATTANPKLKFNTVGDYTIKLRVSNTDGADSLTKTNYIHITSGGTGIEDPELKDKAAIYPNPASAKLYLTPFYKGADLRILNVEGRAVAQYAKVNGSVDISNLAEGLYFVHLNLNGKHKVEKLAVRGK